MVSVFDAGFVLGDGIWEGLRVVGGHPAFLDQHLDRLWEGAAAIALDIGLTRDELTARLYETLRANDMTDGVHIRLMVTRGPKSTPYQDPRFSAGPATVVIIAEHKDPLPATVETGLSLFTVHVRRASPDTLDPKLNAHSKLTDITACIQAYTAGADEALMLDPQGFVATCNSTHFFVVRRGEVWTSSGAYCLGGITRGNVLAVCREAGIPAQERLFSLTDVYSADEAFVTGTFAGVVPVHTIDGRRIGTARAGRWSSGCRLCTPGWSPATSRRGSRREPAVTIRLACWSGPRNISTATMRAWENRPDCEVVDEPLYAWYLAHTGLDHPGRDEVIEAGETDWQRVVDSLTRPWPDGPTLQYQKHMAQHLVPALPRDWIGQLRNVLLIRDPAEVVSSYLRSRAVGDPRGHRRAAAARAARAARSRRCRWSTRPTSCAGPRPTCAGCATYAGVEFTPAMLSWRAGPA